VEASQLDLLLCKEKAVSFTLAAFLFSF